jgi:hypothetical protein
MMRDNQHRKPDSQHMGQMRSQMVVKVSDVLLWAAPRFRQHSWNPPEARDYINARDIAPEQAPSSALVTSRVIAKATSEMPEGAACLYSRH